MTSIEHKERLYDYEDNVNRAELLRYPPSSVHHIPEACHLTWTDPYFDDQPGIIAVFDRDAEKAGNAAAKRVILICMCFAFSLLVSCLSHEVILGILHLSLTLVFAWQAWRTKQSMLAQHVAITTEGIRVEDRSINPFRFLRIDATEPSFTIPFEDVRKISIRDHEFCCRVDPTLSVVLITLRCQPVVVKELLGIINAEEFADLVRALKKHEASNGTPTTSTDSCSHMELPVMTRA